MLHEAGGAAVYLFTSATEMVDDTAMRGVWGIQTQRNVDCAKPKVVRGTGIPRLCPQISSETD